MPTWSELQKDLGEVEPDKRSDFLEERLVQSIKKIAKTYDRNVLYYASAFLQKPLHGGLFTAINMEDIHGFMAGIHGHEADKGLLLILHTPGGLAEAAETIVDYLRSKFDKIDILIPTYAMSAGTMIALACDQIIMGRQSQLGPTDPQLIIGDRPFSAHSIVDQFEEAKTEISENPILAQAWAPILHSFGPALLQEARKSIAYGQNLVQGWLQKYMLSGDPNPAQSARNVAAYFGSPKYRSHGSRIGRDVVKGQGLKVINLENDQGFQDEVLTLYHLLTIGFEQGPALKCVLSSNGRMWTKNTLSPNAVIS